MLRIPIIAAAYFLLSCLMSCINTDIVQPVDTMPADSVDADAATATFMGSSGYIAKGTAELNLENEQVILTLSEDFETSFALGTFVYLANSISGGEVKSNGFEVAEITNNGSHSFNITEIAVAQGKSVTIGTHKYVIILCKPASLTFGYGELIFQPK